MTTEYLGPLHQMAATTPTQYLNDSCAYDELSYAIERGAIGATSNPVIVGNALKKDMPRWRERILQIIAQNPAWSEIRVGWQVYEELAVAGAKMLLPVWERSGHKLGRMSIQTDPAAYNDTAAILAQATYFADLAPNMQIKLPCTAAGVAAIEELTYRGINLNVTVSFCVPQVLAIAEHIERGLLRRDAEGKPSDTMTPYATMMVGRCDDWIKVWVKQHALEIPAEHLEWAGVACFKNAYGIYAQRGYRTQLLSAAYRNFNHWTEFVGGACSLTIPWDWQVKFNESLIKPEPRMHLPVDPAVLTSLLSIPEFRRAFAADGMSVPEFDTFGATVRTLRAFIESWHTFVGVIRDLMLPNPD
jgi:transaldolase